MSQEGMSARNKEGEEEKEKSHEKSKHPSVNLLYPIG